MDGLREIAELVAAEWDGLVGSGVPDGEPIPAACDWFDGPRKKKGEAPQKPAVPVLAGDRNDKGQDAKPVASQDNR